MWFNIAIICYKIMVLSKCMDNDIQNLQRNIYSIKWKDFFFPPKFIKGEIIFP